MEELHNKLRKRLESNPRKVRFRISSAYSGRVLKQVYEDGSESEELEDEAPRRTLKSQLSESFRRGQAELLESWHPAFPSTTCLRACRINVYRDGGKYSVKSGQNLFTDLTATCSSPSNILNFGKIIIYTNNLRIIKKPPTQKEIISKAFQTQLTINNATNRDGKGENEEKSKGHVMTAEEEESEPVCRHCEGTGCVPCSLCHGSKLSMFANRFKESFRAIRCPGCDEHGVQPCPTCAQ